MKDNLIKRLRTCSTKERRYIAMVIAKTGTDEAVEALINLVDGIKSYHRSFFTLWIPIPNEFYELEDQLIGVEALAETGQEKAADYLRNLITKSCSETREYGEGKHDVIALHTQIKFPNTAGPLKEALEITHTMKKGDYLSSKLRALEVLNQNKSYKRIISAYRKLSGYLE